MRLIFFSSTKSIDINRLRPFGFGWSKIFVVQHERSPSLIFLDFHGLVFIAFPGRSLCSFRD